MHTTSPRGGIRLWVHPASNTQRQCQGAGGVSLSCPLPAAGALEWLRRVRQESWGTPASRAGMNVGSEKLGHRLHVQTLRVRSAAEGEDAHGALWHQLCSSQTARGVADQPPNRTRGVLVCTLHASSCCAQCTPSLCSAPRPSAQVRAGAGSSLKSKSRQVHVESSSARQAVLSGRVAAGVQAAREVRVTVMTCECAPARCGPSM